MKNGDATSVLERLLDPVARCLNTESAQALAGLRADPAAQARIDELASRCNEGALTPDERREYESYVHAGSVLAILQAKARLRLKQHAAS